MKYVDIYIVKHLKEPLLGRPAINALDLIATVEAIQSNDASDTRARRFVYDTNLDK